MINLHLTMDIPIELKNKKCIFSRALFINQICVALKHKLNHITNDEFKTYSILCSPALFGIHSAFALGEYIKNTLDANGTQLHFYAKINENAIQTLIIDNGDGFSQQFLTTDNYPKIHFLNYFETKLNRNEIKITRIISPKANKSPTSTIKGGAGMGLAMITRILNIATGKLEIANFSDLPETLIKEMNIDLSAHSCGAAIVLSSPPYSAALHQLFLNTETNYDNQNISELYLNYLTHLNAELSPSASIRSDMKYSLFTKNVINIKNQTHDDKNTSQIKQIAKVEENTEQKIIEKSKKTKLFR